MIRFAEIRSHLTLALGACGMAVALASVPTSSAVVVSSQVEQRLAKPKIYREIPIALSDEPDDSGRPLSYVICTGTRLRSDDVVAAPTEYVVFPVGDLVVQ